jgi:WD40 repeat protein
VAQIDLEPIPKAPEERLEDEDEDAAFGVVAVAMATTMQACAVWGNGQVKFFRVPQGNEVMTLAADMAVTEAALARNGSMMALTDGSTVGVWDLGSGNHLHELTEWTEVTALALTTDGATLAVGRGQGHVTMLNIKSGSTTAEFKVRPLGVPVVVFWTCRVLHSGFDVWR